MGSVITTMRDLSDEANRTQARYELNRAVDLGDQAQQAAWSLNWGEAALDRAENAEAAWDDCGPSQSFIRAVETAVELTASLQAILASDKPDLAAARDRVGKLREQHVKLVNGLEAEE